MINLLPPEMKAEYRYARRNSRMVNIIVVLAIGFGGLLAITVAGVLYIQRTSNTYTAQAQKLQQELKDQKQDEIKAQAKDISSSLKLAVQVLSQEVLFSQLLQQLATAIPSNASLTGINIRELAGGVDIAAKTANYNAATQLQVNLSDPANKIFSKADIVNISCGTTSQGNQDYPCSVSVRVQFAKDNPFLFINDKVAN